MNISTDDEYSIITWELQEVGNLCLDNFMLIKDELGDNFESERYIKFTIDKDLPTISCTLDRLHLMVITFIFMIGNRQTNVR